MLQNNRSKYFAFIVFILAIAIFTPRNVNACEEIPQTLLSLYMNSDVIVLANYESDGVSTKTHEDEYGYTLELERNLRILRVLKGANTLETISFRSSDYFPVNQEDLMNYDHSGDYFDISKIKLGSQYLFFLTLDKDTGSYYITDYSSGVKQVRGKFDIYENDLAELESIVKDRKDQLPRLTEWMVKLLEEPETRRDAINDLSESFYAMEYAEENTEEPVEEFLSNENYYRFTSQIGKQLTPTQKSRISGVLYPYLQESWFAAEPVYVDYGVSAILSNLNRPKLALFTYNILQSVDKHDVTRRNMVMSFLADSVRDEDFSQIYYDISNLQNELSEVSKLNDKESKAKAKAMTTQLEQLLKDFEVRFKFMYKRNFAPIAKG
ncbi:MAG: hypothetical protein KIS76_06440 [Pyrinomonadaceae bacterium]|nr:hypothetical protein [Pyrinomonadaceae bacterium]